MRPARDTWVNPVLALGLCAGAGALFSWPRTPLPRMIGPLLVFAALFAIAVAWACARFLSRTTDTDRSTAFFASVPGGATEMAILGERFGARVDRIALAQSLRILAVVIVVPFALTYSGAQGSDIYRPPPLPYDARASQRCSA